ATSQSRQQHDHRAAREPAAVDAQPVTGAAGRGGHGRARRVPNQPWASRWSAYLVDVVPDDRTRHPQRRVCRADRAPHGSLDLHDSDLRSRRTTVIRRQVTSLSPVTKRGTHVKNHTNDQTQWTDLYLRHQFDDTGLYPTNGAQSASPDVIPSGDSPYSDPSQLITDTNWSKDFGNSTNAS